MKEFDLSRFKKSLGLTPKPLEPFNYSGYKKINPKLSIEVYNHLRANHSLWKVYCGKEVYTHWGQVILARVWWLDTPTNYANRYIYPLPV